MKTESFKVGDIVGYHNDDVFWAKVVKVNPKTLDINVFGRVYKNQKISEFEHKNIPVEDQHV